MWMLASLIVSLVVAVFSGAALAGPLEAYDGKIAYERGDYAAALRVSLANQSDSNAQVVLGLLFSNGQGVIQNSVQAAKWYRKAADQGNEWGQLSMGVAYNAGEGVPQDYVEAAKWYRMAADRGNAIAQFNLAGMYVQGMGVPQDYVQAHKWFNLAASRWPASLTETRDSAYMHRNNVAAKMTPAQIAEAQRLAREWKPN